MCWKADIDRGIDLLNLKHPDKWLRLAPKITEWSLRNLVDELGLNYWQSMVVKYYLLGEEIFKVETETPLRVMCRRLNKGVKV